MTPCEAVEKFGPDRVSPGVMKACNDSRKIRGLGDLVAAAIKTVSRGKIKPCGGCKKRQKWLNKIVPISSHPPDSP